MFKDHIPRAHCLRQVRRHGYRLPDGERSTHRLMTNPQRRRTGDRWDGWDDPDYQPTDEELNEPVKVNATPEELAEALMGR